MNFITILSIFQSIFSKFSDYLLLILFLQHYMAAGFIGADQLAALFYHITAADRAFFLRRLLPGHEITFRIILTAVIFSSLLGSAKYHVLAAFRARYADFFQIWLGIAALREARASKKTAMGSRTYTRLWYSRFS